MGADSKMVKISGKAYDWLQQLVTAEPLEPCRTLKWQLEKAIAARYEVVFKTQLPWEKKGEENVE